MRRSFLLLFVLFLAFSYLPHEVDGEDAKTLDISQLYVEKSLVLFRYPEVMGFTLPSNAVKLRFIGKKLPIAVQLFELAGTEKVEYSVRKPLRTELGNSVSLAGLQNKRLYALLAFDTAPDANMPLVFPACYGDQLDELVVPRISHITGWVDVKTAELQFISHSPIVSFLPRLTRTDAKGFIVRDFVEVADPTCGMTFRFLSPFRVNLIVPNNYPYTRVCAEMELLDGFARGGQIVVKHLTKNAPLDFLPAKTYRRLAPHARRSLPEGTASVRVIIACDEKPVSANIGLHGGDNLDCACLLGLSFTAIDGEPGRFEAVTEITAAQEEERATEILGGTAAKYSFLFVFNAFGAPYDLDVTGLVKVFECLDKDGAVLEDLAKNPPFVKVE